MPRRFPSLERSLHLDKSSPEIAIVPYEDKYRGMVRRCLYETGYGGETAEIYFEDLELFADVNFNSYYTGYEPESGFIPLVDGEPAGYLLGCTDTARFEETVKKKLLPALASDILKGRYNVGPLARRYMLRGTLMMMRGEMAVTPHEAYPAHLHIDLFKPYRRYGLGSCLMHHYFDYLRSNGVHGLHLNTSSAHVQGVPFYEKLGFRRFSVHRAGSSIFREISDTDFYNITYVKYI